MWCDDYYQSTEIRRHLFNESFCLSFLDMDIL